MRMLNRDSVPHLTDCVWRLARRDWDTFWSRWISWWWGISLGKGCSFHGLPSWRRHPGSSIVIGGGCQFLSTPASNRIGINHPCVISTLAPGAELVIGKNCGFSGTVIGCAKKIILGDNVICGANTLVNDTDWHSDDPRTGPDLPVVIGNNVWLGVNVTVLKGVTIGENTLVAAGSVVTRSLAANVVAAGVPAKVIKSLPSETR